MNHLSLYSLIPKYRTIAYYNELIPIAEAYTRLQQPNINTEVKVECLKMIRSIFRAGNSDKIKACLDMRVPNYLVVFLQDLNEDVRNECLITFNEISKGLVDDEFEIITRQTIELKRNLLTINFKKTVVDIKGAIAMQLL